MNHEALSTFNQVDVFWMAIFEAPVRFSGGPGGDDQQEEMEHFPREPASLGAFGTLGLDLVPHCTQWFC